MANDTRRFYIKVDAEGFLIGLFDTVYGEPTGEQIAGFVEVNQDVFDEISEYQGLRRFVNGKVIPYAPPPPPLSSGDVDQERDRRIDGGFSFGGVFYQTRPEDRENIAGASTAALAAIMNGAEPGDYRWHGGDTDFVWIAADNSMHAMDAQTLFAFGQAAMAHKQAHIFAARSLKDAEAIPADYADDQYWPTAITA